MSSHGNSGKMDDTRSGDYTDRLVRMAGARWKRLLGDRDPYSRNLRRWMGPRRTIDVGCGIGRNLAHLGPGSVGVDHNAESVRYCRARGLDAYLPDEFLASPRAMSGAFTGLLCAHVLEHLEPGAAPTVLKPYRDLLDPGSRVMLVCPQKRGFASDPTHTIYVDQPALAAVCAELGLAVVAQRSFPFPAWAGRWFIYNEFVTIATTGGGGEE